MNTLPRRLRREEGARFSQDLPLLAQDPILPLKRSQPRPLIRGQHVRALTPISLLLPQPVTQRLRRAAKLARQLPGRAFPDGNNRPASRRNSAGYGGLVLAISTPSSETRVPNHQVCTKPRQLQPAGELCSRPGQGRGSARLVGAPHRQPGRAMSDAGADLDHVYTDPGIRT